MGRAGAGSAAGPVLRRAVVAAAVLRYVIPIAAIPFIGVLVPDDLLLLVLIRPGKEILLLGGGLWRTTGAPPLLGMFLAYLPLMVGGVWAFFLLGRIHGDALRRGEGPAWLDRLIPPDKLELAQLVLERHGPIIAVLGRVAAMPPTLVAAAAGTSTIDAPRYLAADLAGAVLSFAIVVGIGVVLGDAHERGGPWLTGAGIVLVALLFAMAARWARREAERVPETEEA